MLDITAVMKPTQEQNDLRQSLHRLLASSHDTAAVRRRMDEGVHDPSLWAKLAAEMGLATLTIPERFGGAGFGVAEQVVVMEELGYSLYDGPFLSSAVMAVDALLLSRDESACLTYLPAIATGERTATVAFMVEGADWTLDGTPAFSAKLSSDGWSVDGEASYVIDGATAEVVLVLAASEQGPVLLAVDGPDVTAHAVPTLDQTRRLASVQLAGAAGVVVGTPGDGKRIILDMLDRAAVALGAEQLGVAKRCLEMAVEYAKLREQFGQPIGQFQAVKHLCADMYLAVETSRSAVMFAARATDERTPDAPAAASLVKAWCSDAVFRCAADTMQVHGGIGFTWESDIHLYFKRAESSSLLFGDADHHRAVLADRIGF